MRISDWSSDVCSSDLLEGDALEAADLLAELLALGGVGDRVVEGAARAAHGHGRDGEPGRVEPVVGQLEAAVRLAQDLRRRQPAVVEAAAALVIAAGRNGVVAPADLEARGPAVDQNAGDLFLRPRRGIFSAAGDAHA